MKYFFMLLCVVVMTCQSSKTSSHSQDNRVQIPEGKFIITLLNNEAIFSKKPLTIIFDKDNNAISGFAGCNQYGASFTVENENILSVGMIQATEMYCEKTSELERNIMQAIKQINHCTLSNNVLTLFNKEKVLLLKAEKSK